MSEHFWCKAHMKALLVSLSTKLMARNYYIRRQHTFIIQQLKIIINCIIRFQLLVHLWILDYQFYVGKSLTSPMIPPFMQTFIHIRILLLSFANICSLYYYYLLLFLQNAFLASRIPRGEPSKRVQPSIVWSTQTERFWFAGCPSSFSTLEQTRQKSELKTIQLVMLANLLYVHLVDSGPRGLFGDIRTNIWRDMATNDRKICEQF